jgi:hypothetical protein
MSDKPEEKEPQTKVEQSKVDEFNGVFFSTSVKIHDPNTEEVLVQLRGDI